MRRTKTVAVGLGLALLGCGKTDTSTEGGTAATDTPTAKDVEAALKPSFEASGKDGPRATLALNDVKFGKPYRATAQEVQVDGLPDGGTVTPAVIDFTVRTFYTGQTRALRRVRESSVYRNKMGEWVATIGSARGEDMATTEPAPQ